ncbi:MAG: hypothetical protein KIT31_06990 [Deltaproteobacteria bacterium]|nr:hypothetical protein [Deltaproteobacteria bacterium]
MGTCTSWIAIEGASVEQVARELRLRPAPADAAEDPDAGIYMASVLPGGWVLLVHRLEYDGVVADREQLEKLSRGRRVVGCDEESHVMYSAASEWREGREVWAVIHSSEEALDHLHARGDLPAGWSSVKDELMAQHAAAAKSGEGVDYAYEVPLVTAKLVVGYRFASEDDDDLEVVALVAASE